MWKVEEVEGSDRGGAMWGSRIGGVIGDGVD